MITQKLWKAVCLSWLLIIGQQVLAQGLEFEEGWRSYLNSSDAIDARKANLSRVQYMQDAASAKRLPQIDITGSYTRLDDPVTMDLKDLEPLKSVDISNLPVSPVLKPLVDQVRPVVGKLMHHTVTEVVGTEVTTSAVRATWPIFTGGRISALQTIAGNKTEEARQRLAMEQQTRFEEFTQRYFATVLAARVLDARREAEAGLLTHYEYSQKLEKQGQIARVERLKAQASYDKARVDRKKAEHDLQLARAALASMLKNRPQAVPVSPLFINNKLPTLDHFTRKTLNSYPGLEILDARKKQAEGMITLAKGKYYPEVMLFGRYNLHKGDSIAAKSAPDWAVGVGVKLSLLDSSGRSGKMHAAYSAVDQIGYLRAQVRRDITLLVEKTYTEADQAREEFHGLASSLELAQENVQLREKSFTQGLSTSLDVVDARLFLASIQTQRLAAAYHYVVSLGRLLALSGDISSFHQYQNRAGQGVVK